MLGERQQADTEALHVERRHQRPVYLVKVLQKFNAGEKGSRSIWTRKCETSRIWEQKFGFNLGSNERLRIAPP